MYNLLNNVVLQSELQGIEIYADLLFRKVIYNLVENSIRHGKHLTRITLTSHKDKKTFSYGMRNPGDEKEKVFEKGFGKNTELGLFLIREILSITGIIITEAGEPGVGVRFEIRVPEGKYRYV